MPVTFKKARIQIDGSYSVDVEDIKPVFGRIKAPAKINIVELDPARHTIEARCRRYAEEMHARCIITQGVVIDTLGDGLGAFEHVTHEFGHAYDLHLESCKGLSPKIGAMLKDNARRFPGSAEMSEAFALAVTVRIFRRLGLTQLKIEDVHEAGIVQGVEPRAVDEQIETDRARFAADVFVERLERSIF